MNVDMPVKPFSFAKRIYINPKLHTAEEVDEIIRHELVHINQYHSIDIIASTINRIIFWWNPVVMVLNGDIRNNLEYIVDSEMLQTGTGRKHYQYNILNISQMTYINGIANYFNLHNLKKRIKMMNKEKTQPVYKIKWLLLIPVATVILLSFNMKRAVATNVDFVVNSEISEPEPAPVIEADTLADKNLESEKVFIRGNDSAKSKPLVIINDKESDVEKLQKLNVDSISSFSILKEESAIKLFGEEGKNGVVIVMTKGYENKDSKNGEYIKTKTNGNIQNLNQDTIYSIILKNNKIKTSNEIEKDGTIVMEADGNFPSNALIIIDGKETDMNIHNLDVDIGDEKTICSLSVLKGDAAIKAYGEKGKNGVIVIETKENKEVSNPQEELVLQFSPDDALVIINGKETDMHIRDVDSNAIRSLSVMKGDAAIKRYGKKGKNGVIVIETKENKEVLLKTLSTDVLVIIDGKETDVDVSNIDPDIIHSLSIFKGDAAIALYGVKGKNGVIVIETKENENKNTSTIIVDKKDQDVDISRLISHNDAIDIIELYSEDGKSGVLIRTKKDEEASNLRNQLSLRGFTDSVLIIIDEKERDSKELQNLNPETIRSISILKNNTAIEVYGEKGKNGVIVIETKGKINNDTSLKSHIEAQKQNIEAQKQNIEAQKQNIEAQKQNIEARKQNIEAQKQNIEAQKQKY
jgi:TonB-dependent SusC/RagA subfamily outer membrane receptor